MQHRILPSRRKILYSLAALCCLALLYSLMPHSIFLAAASGGEAEILKPVVHKAKVAILSLETVAVASRRHDGSKGDYAHTLQKDTLTAYIKKLTHEAISAEFRLDTAAISRIMDADFISIYPHKTQNKQQELAGMYKSELKRRKEEHTIENLDLEDFTVKVFDNTLVATYYSVTRGKKKGVPFTNARMRWYDVWVKRKGEWKWVASQGTWITTSQDK